jgi:hypothetical protein
VIEQDRVGRGVRRRGHRPGVRGVQAGADRPADDDHAAARHEDGAVRPEAADRPRTRCSRRSASARRAGRSPTRSTWRWALARSSTSVGEARPHQLPQLARVERTDCERVVLGGCSARGTPRPTALAGAVEPDAFDGRPTAARRRTSGTGRGSSRSTRPPTRQADGTSGSPHGTLTYREFWARRGYDWRDVRRRDPQQAGAEQEEIEKLGLAVRRAGGSPRRHHRTSGVRVREAQAGDRQAAGQGPRVGAGRRPPRRRRLRSRCRPKAKAGS